MERKILSLGIGILPIRLGTFWQYLSWGLEMKKPLPKLPRDYAKCAGVGGKESGEKDVRTVFEGFRLALTKMSTECSPR
jgi:hypothetical protein